MLLMCFQSSRFIDNSSSCLHTMEIVFTRCDCIRFPTFFFVDLYAKFYFSTCMCLSSSLIFFYIETSTFPIFGHGFRISSYRRAQVWKVHPFSKNILNYSPSFWCVFKHEWRSVTNPGTQNFSAISGLWWSPNFLPSCSLSLEVFLTAHFSLTNSSSKFKCQFLCDGYCLILPSPILSHNTSIDGDVETESVPRSGLLWLIL